MASGIWFGSPRNSIGPLRPRKLRTDFEMTLMLAGRAGSDCKAFGGFDPFRDQVECVLAPRGTWPQPSEFESLRA